MPPKVAYKVHPILIKSHKLTICLEAPPTKTVAQLKEEVLSALTSKLVDCPMDIDMDEIKSTKDFEICREQRERRERTMVPVGKFDILDASACVKDTTFPYETLVLRFRENDRLKPATYIPPPINEDEDEEQLEPVSGKGKQRAI